MAVQFGPFTLDVGTRRLTCGGSEIHLTPKAFDLLTVLADAAPHVVRKATLHDRLWPATFVSDATLIGLIKEVRRALSHYRGGAGLVRTVPRVGYALDAHVGSAAPVSASRHWIVGGDRTVVLHDGDNVIGRDDTSDVALDAVSVSRRHARICVKGPTASLEDLGSKNGTTIAGRPVELPVTLRDGDRIEVGAVSLLYRTSAWESTVTNVHER